MSRDAPPLPTIDPVVFARRQQAIEGRSPIAALERLLAAEVRPEGDLTWSLDGSYGRDESGRLREFLDLALAFSPVMTCVRCLEPVTVGPLTVRRRFRLAASERQADLEDREAEEVDVIAVEPRMSVVDLVEDEAILSLPMAPTHDAC